MKQRGSQIVFNGGHVDSTIFGRGMIARDQQPRQGERGEQQTGAENWQARIFGDRGMAGHSQRL